MADPAPVADLDAEQARAPANSKGLSPEVLRALARGLVPFVRECIADATAPLLARIAALEQKPSMKYEGTWDETKAYNAGSFVTHQGALWHAEDTSIGARPGTGSPAWKLAVKRGRGER